MSTDSISYAVEREWKPEAPRSTVIPHSFPSSLSLKTYIIQVCWASLFFHIHPTPVLAPVLGSSSTSSSNAANSASPPPRRRRQGGSRSTSEWTIIPEKDHHFARAVSGGNCFDTGKLMSKGKNMDIMTREQSAWSQNTKGAHS